MRWKEVKKEQATEIVLYRTVNVTKGKTGSRKQMQFMQGTSFGHQTRLSVELTCHIAMLGQTVYSLTRSSDAPGG